MHSNIRVPVVSGLSRAKIEARANALIRATAPECLVTPQPTPILAIFENFVPKIFGFEPLVQNLAPGLEGLTDISTKEVSLSEDTYAGLEADRPRPRFSAAHEVGHVHLHKDELALKKVQLASGEDLRLARRGELKPYLDPEWQANAYAAALLMPEEMVRKAVAGASCWDERVSRIIKIFNVSCEAAERRARTLNL